MPDQDWPSYAEVAAVRPEDVEGVPDRATLVERALPYLTDETLRDVIRRAAGILQARRVGP